MEPATALGVGANPLAGEMGEWPALLGWFLQEQAGGAWAEGVVRPGQRP